MLSYLDSSLRSKWREVEAWFSYRLLKGDSGSPLKVPIYCSVDLRNAGYKLATVDTNLYPAGFNNLCAIYNEECVISFNNYIEQNYRGVKKILVIAEAHSRNKFYIENVRSIMRMLEKDGFEVRVGIIGGGLWKDFIELEGVSGGLTLYRIFREDDILRTVDFVPDLIINNNDFSEGIPEEVMDIAQPIDPSPSLGWANRRKHRHFEILKNLMEDFSHILGTDAWLLYPCTSVVMGVDFWEMAGVDRIVLAIEDLLERVRKKHREYEVKDEPFVFVKSNYGTYGLGVMTALSGDDFLRKIKKERKKMHKGKGGIKVTEVIVQEGVPTVDSHEGCPVEPVIYLIGSAPVGGFYRVHCERTDRENLNMPGMTFSTICFHQLENRKPAFLDLALCSDDVMMRVWGTLGRIAALTAAYEQAGSSFEQL